MLLLWDYDSEKIQLFREIRWPAQVRVVAIGQPSFHG
jgi:hypothetical protein